MLRVGEHDKDKQHSKRERRHREEVARDELLRVVAEKVGLVSLTKVPCGTIGESACRLTATDQPLLDASRPQCRANAPRRVSVFTGRSDWFEVQQQTLTNPDSDVILDPRNRRGTCPSVCRYDAVLLPYLPRLRRSNASKIRGVAKSVGWDEPTTEAFDRQLIEPSQNNGCAFSL